MSTSIRRSRVLPPFGGRLIADFLQNTTLIPSISWNYAGFRQACRKFLVAGDVLRGIALPRSSPRKAKDCYVKLLRHVDPAAEHGFGFEGTFYRAGKTVTPAELRPTEDYPEIPIVLEAIPGEAHGPPGRRRRDQIYILWRYDRDRNDWCEIGRAMSESWSWAIELRPLAVRALKEAHCSRAIETEADLPAIASRIAETLDHELERLEAADRQRVIAVLHDQFAVRLVGDSRTKI